MNNTFITRSRLLLPCFAALGLAAATSRAATYSQTVLNDNPVAYYRLEETTGTTAIDSSATGTHPGSYTVSGIYPQQGQPGIETNSISLNTGAAGYVTAGYYADLNPQGPFSFEIWARPTSTPAVGAYRCPIGNFGGWGTGGGYGSGWYIYQTSDASFAFITSPQGVWITSPYTLFNWYHLVGTFDGTTAKFYVNGTLIGSGPHPAYLANPGNPLALGQRSDGYGVWDGNLDEAALYNYELTANQVKTHYEVGTNSFRTPPVPAIVRQDPVSITNYAGHTVQFTVLADGTPPLSYQWYKNDSPINGQTGTALSFVCAPADDGSAYKAVVTNLYGASTSAVASLTVSLGLAIDVQPTSIIRTEGPHSTAAFLAVVEGVLPFHYQWYRGATAISGATDQTLWVTGLKLTDDQSTYYVRISNPYLSTNSDPATLTVMPRTGTAPTSTYAKVVLNDGPVAYWRLNESGEIAVDCAGSFDGTYQPGAGTFTYNAATGIPRETDGALGITGGAIINIPYALELNPWGPFTVEGWFQPASLAAGGGDYRTAFSSMYNVGGYGPTGWLLYQQGNNTWAWVPYGGNWASVFLPDSALIVANQWYYVALTYDGTTFTMYINGTARTGAPYSGFVQNGNVPTPGTGYHYMYNGSGPTVLGWRSDSDFNPFSGTMDDIAFYNKALSPAQIQAHYAATVRLTITKAGNDVVLSWPFGTLQSAPGVSGTYTNETGVTSPYTNGPAGSVKFYRVQVQ